MSNDATIKDRVERCRKALTGYSDDDCFLCLIDLLADGAAEAKRVTAGYAPRFTKQTYLDFVRKLAYEREYAEK